MYNWPSMEWLQHRLGASMLGVWWITHPVNKVDQCQYKGSQGWGKAFHKVFIYHVRKLIPNGTTKTSIVYLHVIDWVCVHGSLVIHRAWSLVNVWHISDVQRERLYTCFITQIDGLNRGVYFTDFYEKCKNQSTSTVYWWVASKWKTPQNLFLNEHLFMNGSSFFNIWTNMGLQRGIINMVMV